MNHNEIKAVREKIHKPDLMLKLSASQRLRPGPDRVGMTKIIEYFMINSIIEL